MSVWIMACTCNRSSDQSEWEGSYYCSSDYKSFSDTIGRLYVPMQMILMA